MTKTINIDGIEVALRSSGATYIRYRELFKDDLFRKMQDFNGAQGGELPEGAIDTLTKAAYVMALQADKEEKRTLEEWCDQFSMMGLLNALGDIATILIEDRQPTTELKKKSDQPTE